MLKRSTLLLLLCLMALSAGSLSGQEVPEDHILRGNNLLIKLLHQEPGEDGGFEMAEIVFGPGYAGGEHAHPVIEMFYVIEGELDHVVNGEVTTLRPGMVGIVRPPDRVIHRVRSDIAVKAIVIWRPVGEFERITGRDLGGGEP